MERAEAIEQRREVFREQRQLQGQVLWAWLVLRGYARHDAQEAISRPKVFPLSLEIPMPFDIEFGGPRDDLAGK